MESPNLAAALAHARAGRPVFPCSPVTKQPAIPRKEGGRGFKDATRDEEQIRAWWRRWPDAVPGMPTGQQVGVFVLDVDTKPGKVGAETLEQLIETFGVLPDTVEAITATGGRHIYFRHPRDGRLVRNRSSQLGRGDERWGRDGYPAVPFDVSPNGCLVTQHVDVRGDGGYVVMPGSVMADGRTYEWEGSSDPDQGARVAVAPDWLLALVATDPSAPAAGTGADADPAAKVAEGGRNEHLYRLGCSLRAKGLAEPVILAALLAENAERCDPPLPEAEVRASAKSAASKAAGLSPEYEARRRRAEVRRAAADEASTGAPPGPPVDPLPPPPPPPEGAVERPVVQVVAGRLPQAVDAGEAALLAVGAEIFQHGNRLVRVGRWESAPGPIRRAAGAGVLIDITPEWLVETMTRIATWERYDKRSEAWQATDAPAKIAKTLLARTGQWRFGHLLGFCDSPTLLPDGRMVSAPGFDRESGLYLSNPPKIGPIVRPTREAAQDAANWLYELVSTFPFVTQADRSAALALMLTGLLRRVLPAAPMGGISASTPGTGKSLLADCISVLATGRTCAVAAVGKDGEELEKRLDSVLLKGDPVCSFDNVDRPVKSDVLCQVTTQAHKSVRVLAQSRIVEAPTNVLLLMTGNNLTIVGDLIRRMVMVHMDAGVERPELRVMPRDAIEYMLEHRAEGIRCALTISAAYIAAGCPRVEAPPYGSFEAWDRMVRRPLIWAGWPDPLASAEDLRAQDHELTDVADFFEAWLKALGPGPVAASDLYEAVTAKDETYSSGWQPRHPILAEAATALMGAPSKWGPKELGYRLRHWKGRIVQGLRVQQVGEKGAKGRAWQVTQVTTGCPRQIGGGDRPE